MSATQATADAKALIETNGSGKFASLVYDIMYRNEKLHGDIFEPNRLVLVELKAQGRGDLASLFMDYFCK